MLIQKITLCNLNSIQGEQVIDFTKEPLRSAGLFAITGNTGAGKSTILDAICLALYNRAPRFDNVELLNNNIVNAEDDTKRIQPKDVRGMLRRGEKAGYAIVEFSSRDGGVWEATWSVRRKRTGTLDRVSRTLRRLSPKREIIDEREIAQRLPEIIGLDYDQFSRTVMLAQNSFANFLKARRSEKSSLLEKLTGTEIYGVISQRIYQLTDEARRTKEALENQLSGILRDRLEPEDLAEKEQRRDFLVTACQRADDEVQRIQRGLAWMDREAQAKRQVSQCEETYNEAYKACVAARDDQQRIERRDAVLPIQPLYQEIMVRRKDVEELKGKEETLGQQIQQKERESLEVRAALQTAREATLKAENVLTQRRPAINRGHVLMGEIKEGQQQLGKAEELLKEAGNILHERKNVHTSKIEELRQTEQKQEKCQLHRQELSAHKPMFDKFDLLKDQLGQFDAETRRGEEFRRKIADLQQRLQVTTNTLERLEKTQKDSQGKLNTLKSELFIHQQAIGRQGGEQLQQRFAAGKNRLLRLQHAQTLWRRITEGYEEVNERKEEISRHQVEVEQTTAAIERAEREKMVADEIYQRLHVALTLSQSENIVALRRRLKEGTACPVCGATHHPYHTETERELGELLGNLEKDDTEAYGNLQSKIRQLESLRQQLATGEGRLAAERRALEQRIQRQNEDVDAWKECADLDPSFSDCSPSVNREARRLMLELHADNAQKAAAEVEKELTTFNYHQGEINRLNEQLAALNQEYEENQARLLTLQSQQIVNNAALDDQNHALQISERTWNQLYVDLDEMITISAWFATWRNNNDSFRMRLTNLHYDWQQTCRELETLEHRVSLLREEVKNAWATVVEAERSQTRSQDELQAVRESLRLKGEEFARLFGSLPANENSNLPVAEEERLTTAIAQARQEEEQQREKYELTHRAIESLKGARENALQDRQKSQEICRVKSHDLDLWILRYNSNHPPMQLSELDQLFSDQTDWTALRISLDALRKRLTLSEHNLESARAALLEVQNDSARPETAQDNNLPPTAEMLTAALAEAQKQSQTLHDELAELRMTLGKHFSCIKDAERRGKDIDAARSNYEEWARLNTMLGSADGKRFRELAQSYTFGHLVEQANYHLRLLSPRYELHCQMGSLSLTVIDHDMFDEERYVQSLSGGETFVVSLALALGLSSLSTGQITIGSLFIDEGFGNLDEQSLSLVMDALSRLETTQGRKVGVVSHTPQIRQQIHPQIRLVKHPTGGSSEIVIQ